MPENTEGLNKHAAARSSTVQPTLADKRPVEIIVRFNATSMDGEMLRKMVEDWAVEYHCFYREDGDDAIDVDVVLWPHRFPIISDQREPGTDSASTETRARSNQEGL
jgi:hypothetical protein